VDGHHESLASLKEGPVHDVAWSPTGSHFIVIAGFMPAKTVLFDAKCDPRPLIKSHSYSNEVI
jgi:translation initiation factor 2A